MADYIGDEDRQPWELEPMPRPRGPKGSFTLNSSYSETSDSDSTVGLFLNPSYAASSVGGSSLAGGSSLERGLVNNAAYSSGQSSLIVSRYSAWSGSVDSQTALIGSASDSEDCEISPASPFVETSFSFDNSRHFPRRPPSAVPNRNRVSVYVNPNYVPKDLGYVELKTLSETSDHVHNDGEEAETSFVESEDETHEYIDQTASVAFLSPIERPGSIEAVGKLSTIFEEVELSEVKEDLRAGPNECTQDCDSN